MKDEKELRGYFRTALTRGVVFRFWERAASKRGGPSSFILHPSSFARIHRRLQRAEGLVAATMLAAMMAACGFQLRGDQTLPFSSVFVSGNSSYASVAQLRQSVAKVPRTRLVNTLAEADAELKILNESRERIISALSAAGRVREYELRLRINYMVIDKQGNELIAPSDVQLFRLVPYDETQVLSKGQEEALLYIDMQNDAVAQIMRRLAAAKPRT